MPDTPEEKIEKLRDLLDSERWRSLDKRLLSMTELIEAVPVELGKEIARVDRDIGKVEHRSGEHSLAIAELQKRQDKVENGFWFTKLIGGVAVGAAAVAAAAHTFFGGK